MATAVRKDMTANWIQAASCRDLRAPMAILMEQLALFVLPLALECDSGLVKRGVFPLMLAGDQVETKRT